MWVDLPLSDTDKYPYSVICSDVNQEPSCYPWPPESRASRHWLAWEPRPSRGFLVRPRRYDPIVRERLVLLAPTGRTGCEAASLISPALLFDACYFAVCSAHVLWHNPPLGGASAPRVAHFQSMPACRSSDGTSAIPCCRMPPCESVAQQTSDGARYWLFGPSNQEGVYYPVRGLGATGSVEQIAPFIWALIAAYGDARAANIVIQPMLSTLPTVRIFVFPRARTSPRFRLTKDRLGPEEQLLLLNNRGGVWAEWNFAGIEMGLLTQAEWGPLIEAMNEAPHKWGNALVRICQDLSLSGDDLDWLDFVRAASEVAKSAQPAQMGFSTEDCLRCSTTQGESELG